MLTLSFVVQPSTPWWRLLISDIPHDGPAIAGYVLLALFVGMIWLGNRKSSS